MNHLIFVQKKEQEAEKDLVFDIKTLKAKMAQRQKELEEYEKLHPKTENTDNQSNSSDEDKITEGIAPQNTDGQFKDDSDTANIADIKLSENLGGFNNVIEEGGPTARIYFPLNFEIKHFYLKCIFFFKIIMEEILFLMIKAGFFV